MNEIVRYLRKEKDILQIQYETSMQETKKLKFEVEILSRELSEVRMQLVEVQNKKTSFLFLFFFFFL